VPAMSLFWRPLQLKIALEGAKNSLLAQSAARRRGGQNEMEP
jgi:hypothetical protein